jgi:hypothetical protein
MICFDRIFPRTPFVHAEFNISFLGIFWGKNLPVVPRSKESSVLGAWRRTNGWEAGSWATAAARFQ